MWYSVSCDIKIADQSKVSSFTIFIATQFHILLHFLYLRRRECKVTGTISKTDFCGIIWPKTLTVVSIISQEIVSACLNCHSVLDIFVFAFTLLDQQDICDQYDNKTTVALTDSSLLFYAAGTVMTPNYMRSFGLSVSPWCDCSSSGNSKPDCDKFAKFFTNNRCLRKFSYSVFSNHAWLFPA